MLNWRESIVLCAWYKEPEEVLVGMCIHMGNSFCVSLRTSRCLCILKFGHVKSYRQLDFRLDQLTLYHIISISYEETGLVHVIDLYTLGTYKLTKTKNSLMKLEITKSHFPPLISHYFLLIQLSRCAMG